MEMVYKVFDECFSNLSKELPAVENEEDKEDTENIEYSNEADEEEDEEDTDMILGHSNEGSPIFISKVYKNMCQSKCYLKICGWAIQIWQSILKELLSMAVSQKVLKWSCFWQISSFYHHTFFSWWKHKMEFSFTLPNVLCNVYKGKTLESYKKSLSVDIINISRMISLPFHNLINTSYYHHSVQRRSVDAIISYKSWLSLDTCKLEEDGPGAFIPPQKKIEEGV